MKERRQHPKAGPEVVYKRETAGTTFLRRQQDTLHSSQRRIVSDNDHRSLDAKVEFKGLRDGGAKRAQVGIGSIARNHHRLLLLLLLLKASAAAAAKKGQARSKRVRREGPENDRHVQKLLHLLRLVSGSAHAGHDVVSQGRRGIAIHARRDGETARISLKFVSCTLRSLC